MDDDRTMDRFKKLGIPVYKFPEAAAKAMGNMARYEECKRILIKDTNNIETNKLSANRDKTGEIIQASLKEIGQILKKYELNMSPFLIVDDLEEALNFYNRKGAVALKIANEEIIHKSDLGMVKLNLSSTEAVEKAFKEIITQSSKHLNSKIKPQILVQQMVSEGTELALGAKKDPQYGSIIMFGIGGVFVELYKDVVFRVLPIGLQEAKRMINEIQGVELLKGFRSYPAVDIDSLAKIIVKFSKLIVENPDILEMDLNPLIWTKGASEPIIVDCRMTVEK
jgi:acetyltransferase